MIDNQLEMHHQIMFSNKKNNIVISKNASISISEQTPHFDADGHCSFYLLSYLVVVEELTMINTSSTLNWFLLSFPLVLHYTSGIVETNWIHQFGSIVQTSEMHRKRTEI